MSGCNRQHFIKNWLPWNISRSQRKSKSIYLSEIDQQRVMGWSDPTLSSHARSHLGIYTRFCRMDGSENWLLFHFTLFSPSFLFAQEQISQLYFSQSTTMHEREESRRQTDPTPVRLGLNQQLNVQKCSKNQILRIDRALKIPDFVFPFLFCYSSAHSPCKKLSVQ